MSRLMCGGLLAMVWLMLVGCGPCASNANKTSNNADMSLFSTLFKKKVPKAPSTVNPIVGAELVPIDSLPNLKKLDDTLNYGTVKTYKYSGKSPNIVFAEGRPVSISNAAYVAIPEDPTVKPVAFINKSPELVFETWELNSDLSLNTLVDTSNMHPNQAKWYHCMAEDIHCLPNERIIFNLFYSDPIHKTALYTYSTSSKKFHFINNNVCDNIEINQYCKPFPISKDSTIVVYYSVRTRQSAEFYHNYYNHLLLFSPKFPDGLEFLKLGIDDGNVETLSLKDGVLYLETWDIREHGHPKQRFFSIDLNTLLNTD